LAAAPVVMSSVLLFPLITGVERAAAAALGLVLWRAVLLVLPVPVPVPDALDDAVVLWFAVVDWLAAAPVAMSIVLLLPLTTGDDCAVAPANGRVV
jgi:hypothetical protein